MERTFHDAYPLHGTGNSRQDTAMNQRTIVNRKALLDASEALFSLHGYYSVSVRQITRQAGVRMAEVTDLFGGKENLFYEVIQRRAAVINAMRCEGLEQVDENLPPDEQFRAVIGAFFDPLLIKSSESEGWRNYLKLVPQMMRQKTPVLSMVASFYNPISQLFLGRIKQIYPNVSPAQLSHHWHFCLATYFSVFSDDFRVDALYPNYDANEELHTDFAEAYSQATAFVFSGIRSILVQDK
ncbi:MAG: hypothetical protein CL583_18915 [Alteromonadaceae bacterium]|nr:hypothetical protein [Alteromonadaceae bacterium]